MSRAKQRLRAAGIAANEVSASRMMLVPHTNLVVAEKGDPLFDPRSLDPVDEAMAANMVERVNAGETPNRLALLVWERPGCAGLLVGDGHQRTNALGRASELLGGRVLMVLVEFFDGDDEKAFLLERARRNDHDRFAKKDRASVLAFRVKQLTAVGATEREIVDAMPKGVGPAVVEALTRWHSVAADVRPRIDSGEVPLDLLPALLEAPRDEQSPKADKLLAQGIRTAKGATRQANKAKDERDPWARRMSPRQASAMAGVVGALSDAENPPPGVDCSIAHGVSIGLRLRDATGEEAKKILRSVSKPIADAIREARAGRKL